MRRQHVVDVKKSGDFGHPVQSADDLASRRIFLHAYGYFYTSHIPFNIKQRLVSFYQIMTRYLGNY